MAAPQELKQEAVLRFLAERGGRAPNADLLEHFRGFLNSPEPQRRARARERFKELVNAVATVRQEPGSGAKYVQLRKKYRSSAVAASSPAPPPPAEEPRPAPEPPPGGAGGSGEDAAAGPLKEAAGQEKRDAAASTAPAASGEEKAPPAPPPAATEEPRPGPEGGGPGKEEEGAPPRPSPNGGEEDEAAEEEEEEDASPCSPPSAGSPAPGSLLTTTTTAAAATPRGGRKVLRERMLGSSPQMKRGGGGGSGSSRGGNRGGGGGDSDSASVASSSAEEEGGSGGGAGGGSVALDPLEHAWMLCASDGRWESLEGLLSCEPALLGRRDIITGFSCVHWAAKHGRHELLALLVNFGRRHRQALDINARTSGGYTALHLAAMHGHLEVVKLLVGAYDADVDVRDYSGRKAAHYLSPAAGDEVRGLVGAPQDEAESGAPNGGGRWRLSKVLPANLISYRLSHLHHGEEGEPGEGTGPPGKGRELSRKASGSGRIKPRLNKIRFRTQIIHTTPSFRGDAEEEGHEERSLKGSFKLRPKSNVFG